MKIELLFLLIVFPLVSWAQDVDSVYIPNDTVYLNDNNYVVKVAESYYLKPAFLKGKASDRVVLYNGEVFWFIEQYEYYRNGHLKLIGFYHYPDDTDSAQIFYYKHFYRNGNMSDEGQLSDNIFFENKFKYYYRNGKPKEEISVKDSFYHGTYKSFYGNGQLKTERYYEKGYLIKILKYYDQTGFPLDVGTLKDGDGIVNIYSAKGKLKRTYLYRNGTYVKDIKRITP